MIYVIFLTVLKMVYYTSVRVHVKFWMLCFPSVLETRRIEGSGHDMACIRRMSFQVCASMPHGRVPNEAHNVGVGLRPESAVGQYTDQYKGAGQWMVFRVFVPKLMPAIESPADLCSQCMHLLLCYTAWL